jgi:hypothetical protein
LAATEQSSDLAGDRCLDRGSASPVRLVDHRSSQGPHRDCWLRTEHANMDAAAGELIDVDL